MLTPLSALFSDISAHMEIVNLIPDTCEDNLSEMVTYVLIAGHDSLGNDEDINSNINNNKNNCKDTVNNNQYKQNI